MLGANNLLRAAVGLSAEDSLLIVAEHADCGLYDSGSLAAMHRVADAISTSVTVLAVSAHSTFVDFAEDAVDRFAGADKVLFQARLGDVMRFDAMRADTTMSYAYTASLLASPFCTTPHELMVELAQRLQSAMQGAARWRLTSSDGTYLEGTSCTSVDDDGKFEVQRFPVSTIRPISCRDADGEVRISPWVTSTAHLAYPSESLALAGTVVVAIEEGRITGIKGDRRDVDRLRRHYDRVGTLLDLDPFIVDSWHCGLHPSCRYDRPAADDIARWARHVFASPRYLHFHTCGDYVPGEICLSALDVTVTFDDDLLWSDGVTTFYRRRDIVELIESYGLAPARFLAKHPIGMPL
jgi:hypothetical protein